MDRGLGDGGGGGGGSRGTEVSQTEFQKLSKTFHAGGGGGGECRGKEKPDPDDVRLNVLRCQADILETINNLMLHSVTWLSLCKA